MSHSCAHETWVGFVLDQTVSSFYVFSHSFFQRLAKRRKKYSFWQACAVNAKS